jgi:hypothetical protein
VNARRLDRLLWIAAGLFLLWGWARWAQVESPAGLDALLPVPAAPSLPPRPTPARLGEAAERTAARNPFRLDRRPAPVGFGAQAAYETGMAPPAPPPAFRPPLAVGGIVGPPWEAVLEGVPGREGGVVVRSGSTLGELRVRSVSRDLVVVQGPDTTWRLSIKKAWQ